jgi:two-component system response regulator FixJ
MNTLKVHIVDDDEAVRDSLKAVLEAAGFACETYTSAGDFLNRAERTSGCALVDVRMPGMDGLTLLREISTRQPGIGVVIMTGFADVPLAVRAMREGAVDFVEKPTPPDLLADAVRRAFDKVNRAQADDSERRDAQTRLDRLTEREREVLELLLAGHANKIVAHKLGISPRTVEIHRSRLMEKTGAASLAELVRTALTAGLTGKDA